MGRRGHGRREQLGAFYSDIGRPSMAPSRLRWFCRLDLNDPVPHHLTFSENRLNRFRESDILRHIFERVVIAAMVMGLVKGEGFAVDASVMEANASRYHGKTHLRRISSRLGGGTGTSLHSATPSASPLRLSRQDHAFPDTVTLWSTAASA
jgi:hypothetical protein